MSRNSIRDALYTFFGGATPNISGIKTIFKAQPKEISASQMPAMFFSLPNTEEKRIAAQKKTITYQMYILVVTTGYDTDSQTAEEAFEQIIDAIQDKIRSDKTLGGTVVKMGENFHTSVSVERSHETVLLNAVIQVETEEWVNG